MNKNWWYVIGLIVLVLVLMFVFKDDVGFSPRDGERRGSEGADEVQIFRNALPANKAEFYKIFSAGDGDK